LQAFRFGLGRVCRAAATLTFTAGRRRSFPSFFEGAGRLDTIVASG